MPLTHSGPSTPRRQAMFLLICVFTYLFLSLLVIEQGRTIDSQRALIRDLFGDSLELNSMKARENQQRRE